MALGQTVAVVQKYPGTTGAHDSQASSQEVNDMKEEGEEGEGGDVFESLGQYIMIGTYKCMVITRMKLKLYTQTLFIDIKN